MKVCEGGENMTNYIDRTPYFTAYKEDDNFIRLADINGNYTLLDKDELKELIALLNKCKKEL